MAGHHRGPFPAARDISTVRFETASGYMLVSTAISILYTFCKLVL
jgi:hypothetical protein